MMGRLNPAAPEWAIKKITQLRAQLRDAKAEEDRLNDKIEIMQAALVRLANTSRIAAGALYLANGKSVNRPA